MCYIHCTNDQWRVAGWKDEYSFLSSLPIISALSDFLIKFENQMVYKIIHGVF